MARTKMQMLNMQMIMKIPLKNDTCYAQHFREAYSEPFQASEMKIFVKTVNDLMSTLDI